MPARDLSGPLQQAVTERLKGDTMVSGIAGQRSYDYVSANPVFPFTRCVTTIVTPFEATGGVKGSLILVQVDAFTKEYGMQQVRQLSAAVADALNEAELDLGEGYLIDLTWRRTQFFGDPDEQGVNHGVIEFEALASV
ncbi:DUF3168 domain-containing protein [Inquilinus sp.]|uniref:DUF3168 domain-containing protein n=1 Tax=Inquilinus sp. TaxID=1932117 RepID=UPI0031DE77DE